MFEGYRIPDTDSMVILISNKGDCFEGGYVNESLSIINGIKYYDTNIVRSIKEASATEPNLGNMVVYAKTDTATINNNLDDTPLTDLSITTSSPQKNSVAETILIAIIFIIGITLSYFVGRKSSRSNNTSSPNSL